MIEIIYDHRMPLRDSSIRHFIIHKGTIIPLSHFRSFYFKCFKVAAVMLVIDLVVKLRNELLSCPLTRRGCCGKRFLLFATSYFLPESQQRM